MKLKRVRPNVAPAPRAMARAKSSAAPRDAPTMTSSAGARPPRAGEVCSVTNVRAASRRTAADVEVMTRHFCCRAASGRHAGFSGYGSASLP